MTTTPASDLVARYTDEALAAARTGTNRGAARAAEYLVRLDTPERRYRAHVDGTIRANLSGARYADGVWESVNDLVVLIAAGNEGADLYGERMCRRDQERTAAAREARFVEAARSVRL